MGGNSGCARVCGAHPVKLNMTWYFPDRTIKVKSQKSCEDNYVLSSPNVSAIYMYSTALVFEETFAQTAFVVVSCAVPGLNNVTFLLFLSDKPGCATFQAHIYRPLNSQSKRHKRRAAACFCSCDLRFSRAEFVLLPCCFDLTTLGVRYCRRTPSGLDCWYLRRHSLRLFLQL